jgi:hypothetical protein
VKTQTKEPPTHSLPPPHSHSVLARDGSKLPHSKFRELFLSLVRHAAKPNMSNSWFVKTLVCEDTNQGTTHSASDAEYSFSFSSSFSFCIGRGWQQISPQQVQRTLFIFSSTCRKAEHVEQLLRTHSLPPSHSHSVLAGDGSKFTHSKFRELFLSLVRHAAKPNMSNSWFVRTQTKEPPTPHPPRRTHSHSPPHSHSVTARDGSKLPHSDAGARSNAYSPVPPEIYALFKKANLPRRQAPKNKPSTKTTDPYLKAFKPVTSIPVMSK